MGRALLAMLIILLPPAARCSIPLWPHEQSCQTLLAEHPGLGIAAILAQQADRAVGQNSEARIATQLRELRGSNSFQEMGWVLGQTGYEEQANPLLFALGCFYLTAAVHEETYLPGGATDSRRVRFVELELEGVFKPRQNNLSASVGSEVGTYRLDRLLALNMVPLTVRRSIFPRGEIGSLQYFIKNTIGGNKLAPAEQVKSAEMLLLDYFVKNIDRDPKNYLWHPGLRKLIAIDNGWCLRGNNPFALIKARFVDKRSSQEKKLVFGEGRQPSWALLHRLHDLTETEIRAALEEVVSERAILKLIKRKSKVLAAAARHPERSEGPPR